MLHEVLYHREPAWIVGEKQAERDVRRASPRIPEIWERYPDDYSGKVISIRSTRDRAQQGLPSLANMADRDHPCVTLDLSASEVEAFRNRASKVSSSGPSVVAVTFDDRWGAAAGPIDAAFGTREAAEAAEMKSDDAFDFDGRRFVEASGFASGNLAQTVTHTGTGLYSVKVTPTKNDDTQSGAPAGQVITLVTGGLGANAFDGGYVLNVTRSETRAIVSHNAGDVTLEGSLVNWLDTDDLDIFDAWSTIQAALDQLFTDQGATTFTASQYIRIFAGTYDENVVVNAGFVTTAVGEQLIIEGDPSDDRANISLAPSGGATAFVSTSDRIVLRHLTIAGSPSLNLISDSNAIMLIDDCVFSAGSLQYGIQANASVSRLTVSNCAFDGTFTIAAVSSSDLRAAVSVEGCTFLGNGTSAVGVISNIFAIRGCVFSGWAKAISEGSQVLATAIEEIHNVTIYDCTEGIRITTSVPNKNLRLSNVIFSEVDFPFRFASTGIWPEESATRIGMPVSLRNCLFFNYTNVAYDGTTGKTLAEFEAFNQVDSAGNLDATDPLMTAPATDDFSLTSSSPAIFAGHGSGVITGSNGVAFDPNTPDIGAWSSGVIPTPVVQNPVITAISPNFDGDSFDMTVGQAAGLTVNVYTSPEIPAIFTLEPTTRFGNGDLTITGKIANALYYVYCVTLDGATLIGVSNIVSVLITTTDSGGLPETVDEDLSVLPGVDLLLRDDSHDLARDSRDIVLVDGSLLVRQRLSIALQLFKGEWFLDSDAGVPWLQEILEKGVAVAVIDAILRDKIVATPGVNRVLAYSSEIDSATRTVSVAFTVDTVYGPVEFEGALI